MQPETNTHTEPDGADERRSGRGNGASAVQRARQAAERAKAGAHHVADAAMNQAQQLASRQCRHLADEVGHVCDAVQQAAATLEDAGDEAAARYTSAAARHIESARDYLRDADPRRMYADAAGFVRRHPAAVAGVLVITGVAIARFLKASAPHADPGYAREGYGSYGDDSGDEFTQADVPPTFDEASDLGARAEGATGYPGSSAAPFTPQRHNDPNREVNR